MPFSDRSRKLTRSQEYDRQRRQTHRQVKATFTREEAALLDRYAKREGISTARLVARLSLSRLDDRLFVPRALSDALGRISRLLGSMSTNVNQMAHAANRDALMSRDIDAKNPFRIVHQGNRELAQKVRTEFEAVWRVFQQK
ncbi:MAG: plasmid mobilization protein [Akkermansiaceae bacterium]